jgi:hypothetical protein
MTSKQSSAFLSKAYPPMKYLLLGAVFLLNFMTALPALAQSSALQLIQNNIHDATLREVDGGYEIQTTGGDPYIFTAPLNQEVKSEQHYLSFDYFSATGTNQFQVFSIPPLSEANSVTGQGLAHSEGWSSFSIDMSEALQKVPNVKQLRLDFGTQAGKTIRLRNLQLRAPTEQEKQLVARREAAREGEKQREVRLREYLKKDFPVKITRVAVDEKQIEIVGNTKAFKGRQDSLFLAEVPIFDNVTEAQLFPALTPLRSDFDDRFLGSRFIINANRFRVTNGNTYDRLLSRWAVVRKIGEKHELVSHAHYANNIKPRVISPLDIIPFNYLPEEKPRNKKGLGGVHLGYPISDFDELGIAAATVNMVLNGLFSTTPREGFSPTQFAGETYYVNDREIERFDKLFAETSKRKIIVSAIILIAQAGDAPPGSFSRLIAHPDADPSGIFAMPNVSDAAGLEAYAAALNYLAERYSQPDGKYGRIHHWIMHNEINAGWVWTNAGEKTPLLYMDLYHKSMRLMHLIARQYDPHAQAFISLEHHWQSPNSRIYAGRELLELMAGFSKAEGDFAWALAFHPYPQNLFKPRVWEDNEVKFSFNTPKITFKNLEVLDAWMKQPSMLFNGKPRVVHLTEQGLNSPDYSEKSLNDQAAGMAYTWQKLRGLSTIQAFHYHNWVDNRGEGGLRIGLRRFPDDKDEPLGKKPIWFVYQALDTDKEETAIAFAKPITGVQNWNEVRHRGPIK